MCRCVTEVLKILWKLVTTFCKFRKVESTVVSNTSGNWNEDWEEFSVSVIPNKAETTSQWSVDSKKECNDVIDEVLSEMQPVLKKARKVWYVCIVLKGLLIAR